MTAFAIRISEEAPLVIEALKDREKTKLSISERTILEASTDLVDLDVTALGALIQ